MKNLEDYPLGDKNKKFSHTATLKRHKALSEDITTIPLTIAVLHMYPKLGAIDENIGTLALLVNDAFKNGANIVVAPEAATTGYSITSAEVLTGGLGLRAPFDALADLKAAASINGGYVILGIAEIDNLDGNAYNTALVFKPDGTYATERKRGVAVWNSRGNDAFNVWDTPYGKIGMVICSDTYLMDWPRILTLANADIIITPANWWGTGHQLAIWSTRAHENGIYMIVANRWGNETDNRFNPPYFYNMNDAPSAIVAPTGDILLSYSSNQDPNPENKILHYNLTIPTERVNPGGNPAWAVNYRQVKAYADLAAPYYRPDLGDKPAPNLPSSGITITDVMTYIPRVNSSENVAYITSQLKSATTPIDMVLLPALGIETSPVNTSNPNWYLLSPWTKIQRLIENKEVKLLVTGIIEDRSPADDQESITIFRPRQTPIIRPSIQSYPPELQHEAQPPLFLDLPNARVGFIYNRDMVTPEVAMSLTREGTDILVVTSQMGFSSDTTVCNDTNPSNVDCYTNQQLLDMWQTASNDCMHIVASSNVGLGMITVNGGGYISDLITLHYDNISSAVVPLDSSSTRIKYLNAYYDFDLQALLHQINSRRQNIRYLFDAQKIALSSQLTDKDKQLNGFAPRSSQTSIASHLTSPFWWMNAAINKVEAIGENWACTLFPRNQLTCVNAERTTTRIVSRSISQPWPEIQGDWYNYCETFNQDEINTRHCVGKQTEFVEYNQKTSARSFC